MSTIKSSAENLTLNADGSGNDIIIQSNASTKAIVTAEGTVGIGTASPSRLLTLYGDTGIALQNSTTGTGTGNGTHIWVNSAGSGELLIQNRENSDIEFYTNDTVRMRLLAAGGLTFGSDTAAANALDDYEEGTFTPVLKFGGNSVGITYSEQSGVYTKVGRMVYASIRFTMTSEGSSTGDASIGGLPFTSVGTAGSYGVGAAGFATNFYGSTFGLHNHIFVVDPGNSSMHIRYITDGGNCDGIDEGDFQNDSQLVVGITYQAA